MEDQGVWEVIDSSVSTAATVVEKAKDRKAKAHLLQCIPDDLLMQVAGKATGKEVWDTLKALFVGEDRVKDARLQTLRSEFDSLRMKEGDSIDHYAGVLSGMVVRYGSLGGSLGDQALVKKLLDTVPERFIHVVAGIEQFFDLKKMSFADAVGRLKAFEERTGGKRSNSAVKSEPGQALLTQAEWEARYKHSSGENSSRSRPQDGGGGGRGRGRGRGRSGGGRGEHGDGSVRKDKSHIKCFKCHLKGHYANRCPGAEKKNEEEARHAKVEFEPAVLLAETVELGLQKNLLSKNC
jgi:hypothetical protein